MKNGNFPDFVSLLKMSGNVPEKLETGGVRGTGKTVSAHTDDMHILPLATHLLTFLSRSCLSHIFFLMEKKILMIN